MLDKIKTIRDVLNIAVDLELPGSATALMNLNEINARLLELEDAQQQDEEISEGVAHG